MKKTRESEPRYFDIRGLRYHVRRWPGSGARVVLLHGWMDVSASFQFLADALPADWDLYAPDWRGYGLTQWSGADCYWFPDYMADLDRLLDHIEPDAPARVVGHSLGGNAAMLYAGVRPQRVAKLVNLEGFGMGRASAEEAPARYARWFNELRKQPGLRPYRGYAELADRLQANNPRLTRERAEFLARHWGVEGEGGGVVLRSDPAHKLVNANLYRLDEALVCWARITAPVLWVEAALSETPKRIGLSAEERASRRAAVQNLTHAVVDDAGHMLHHDQPEAVAALIDPFLRA